MIPRLLVLALIRVDLTVKCEDSRFTPSIIHFPCQSQRLAKGTERLLMLGLALVNIADIHQQWVLASFQLDRTG